MHAVEKIDFRGMPAIRWRGRDGATAIATLQGAHLVSWTLPGGEEQLFLSDRAVYQAGRAIRGGIPVCFPQFADRGPLAQQHGFARTLAWSFEGVHETAAGRRASFVLESSAQTLALWPHAFRVTLEATIAGRGLEVALRVENRSAEAWDFTAALHTYLRITDAAGAKLHGLRAVRYLERGAGAIEAEARDFIPAREPIDRTYFATPRETRLEDGGRGIRIAQRGFTDTVVWNPGAEKTAQMPDMDPQGYLQMLCVEAAAVEPRVSLPPGALWTGAQSVSVER
jgi:glucose-6-phosphate 1-epimerase